MSDSYLSIAAIADDEYMLARLNACVTQQFHLGNITIDPKWGEDATAPLSWVSNYRYLWASSPGWGESWSYALNVNTDPSYEPGKDIAVITDEMILSAVQTLAGTPPPPVVAPAAAEATNGGTDA